MSNTSDFTFKKEDHTLGNMLTEHLKQHPNVLMAGYKGIIGSAFFSSSLSYIPSSHLQAQQTGAAVSDDFL